MTLEMMDTDDRLAEGEPEAMRNARADEQRAGQSGADRHGDRVDVLLAPPRLGKCLIQQGQATADVVARCQFRHHAAVGLVHVDLAVERLRQQAGVTVEQGDAGFIAGRLDSQDQHGGSVATWIWLKA